MKPWIFYFLWVTFHLPSLLRGDEITPYKFAGSTRPFYEIPLSSIYQVQRLEEKAPNIPYYLSKPSAISYPIAILCGGSQLRDSIESIIHFHRYFLKEFLDLNTAVLTIEPWGVEGNIIDEDTFMDHYTRSQRLQDHETVIEHLIKNPPAGWNGKLIFLGVSEGGPLVTRLTQSYSDITLATLNWSGAGDFNWQEELRSFIENLQMPISTCLDVYDEVMEEIKKNPTSDLEFMGMTYKYHEDALSSPVYEYEKIKSPFLVVAGGKDPILDSCNAFVTKARLAKVNIDYLLIPDMDHYIRKRPDVIEKSFDWLKSKLSPNLSSLNE